MKRILLYVLFVLSAPVCSFAQKPMTAIEFNDKLVDITDSLYAMGQTWGSTFSDVRDSRNFSELAPVRIKLGKFLDDEIAYLSGMKDVGSSKDMRLGLIGFLQFEKKMVTEAFLPLERLSKTSTDKQIENALDHLTTESKKEEVELNKFAVLQEAYAKNSGFKIEPRKDQ